MNAFLKLGPANGRAGGLLCAVALVGCASTTPAKPTIALESGATPGLASVVQAQERRISELETRIALLEQEARSAKTASKPTTTVRIGNRSSRDDDALEQPALQPVTVVRLHEEPRRLRTEAAGEPYVLPAPPQGVSTRLPVVPLPTQAALTANVASSSVATVLRDPEQLYREGLGYLRERKLTLAIERLGQLIDQHPSHALVSAAVYWRGEAHYAGREYREALSAFEQVALQYPSSAKAPDALLKAGLCHQRLGQGSDASRYFELVRKQHPHSAAAQSIPREGST